MWPCYTSAWMTHMSLNCLVSKHIHTKTDVYETELWFLSQFSVIQCIYCKQCLLDLIKLFWCTALSCQSKHRYMDTLTFVHFCPYMHKLLWDIWVKLEDILPLYNHYNPWHFEAKYKRLGHINLLAAHHDIFQAICLLHTPLQFLFITVQAMAAFHLMTNAPINWRVE